MDIVRTQREVDEQITECIDRLDYGASRFPGLTYEDGVLAFYDWLIGDVEESPMERQKEY